MAGKFFTNEGPKGPGRRDPLPEGLLFLYPTRCRGPSSGQSSQHHLRNLGLHPASVWSVGCLSAVCASGGDVITFRSTRPSRQVGFNSGFREQNVRPSLDVLGTRGPPANRPHYPSLPRHDSCCRAMTITRRRLRSCAGFRWKSSSSARCHRRDIPTP